MVHSFLTRIFSLLNYSTVKIHTKNVNNSMNSTIITTKRNRNRNNVGAGVGSASLAAIIVEEEEQSSSSSISLTATATPTMTRIQSTTVTVTTDNNDEDSFSPVQMATLPEMSQNQLDDLEGGPPSFLILNEARNRSLNDISSSENILKSNPATKVSQWCNNTTLWCDNNVSTKDNELKKPLHETTYDNENYFDEEVDEEDALSEINQQLCINSKKFRLHQTSDNNNNNDNDNSSTILDRRRRRFFFIIVGLIISLILASTLTMIVILVNYTPLMPGDISSSSYETNLSSTNVIEIRNSTEVASTDFPTGSTTTESPTTSVIEEEEAKLSEAERKRQISRLSWELINRRGRHHKSSSGSSSSRKSQLMNDYRKSINNVDKDNNNSDSNDIIQQFPSYVPSKTDVNSQEDDSEEEEIILPARMVYTSSDFHLRHPSPPKSEPTLGLGDGGLELASNNLSNNNSGKLGSNNKKSCCKTQKYSQVIRHDGCESVTITNRMCIGQCISVWVPGLFASFPVCKPSRSVWRNIKLKCGEDGSKVQNVKVERVRRCSCMQIEPNNSHNNANVNSYSSDEDKR